jgi:protein-tyrosine-phosphatase
MHFGDWSQRLWRALQDFSLSPLGSNIAGAIIISIAGFIFFQIADQNIYIISTAAILAVLGLLFIAWKYLRPSRTVVFVSSGGTCRDPMAKVIASKLLGANGSDARITIVAAALNGTSATTASHGARTAIKDLYAEDLLANHKPRPLTERLASEADLILVMDHSLLKESKNALRGWPTAYSGKVYLFKEFFGLQGDIADPWPDGKDQQTIARYRTCAEELQQIMTANFDKLLAAL